MGVGVDEAGDHRPAGQVDELGARPGRGPYLLVGAGGRIFPSRTAIADATVPAASMVRTRPPCRMRSAGPHGE